MAVEFSSSSDGLKYFVSTYGADLQQALTGSGIYFAVAVAQKCQESGYGTSDLAVKYNNFGGIYNFGHLAGAIGTTTKKFAIFQSPYHCFASYVKILLDPTKKYIQQGLLTATTPQEQLKAIALGGYCEDPPGMAYYSQILPNLKRVMLLYNIGKL